MKRTAEQQNLVDRCAADSRKPAIQLVIEQRDILCRVAVALGKSREDWDGDSIAGEVDTLRIRAETLADIVRRFAALFREGEVVAFGEAADECERLLASADRWAP